MGDLVIEHREGRRARYLRQHRLRAALALAALEGILVLAGVIRWWVCVLLAGGSLALYLAVRGDARLPAGLRTGEGRQLIWILALSQLLVVVVPVAAAILTVVAIVVLVVFALGAVAVLLLDRR